MMDHHPILILLYVIAYYMRDTGNSKPSRVPTVPTKEKVLRAPAVVTIEIRQGQGVLTKQGAS